MPASPTSPLLHEHNLLMQNDDFAARVRAACIHIACEVLTSEIPETHGHPLRVALARTVLTPDLTTPGLAPVIAVDPRISAVAAAGYDPATPDKAQQAITDEDILTAVRAAWNLVAGVPPEAPLPEPAGTPGQ